MASKSNSRQMKRLHDPDKDHIVTLDVAGSAKAQHVH